MSKKTTKISIGLCLGLILGFQELNASALSASDFNILDGLAGLRPDLLLKITREIKDPRDKQNFWGMCTSTSWLSENLLFEEAEKGNTDALNKIKSRTPDETGRSPIHYASQKGYLSVLKFLLDNGADVNQKITADLVASPYDDDKGMTPLYFASFNNKLAVVEELIARGADVNFATKARVTPLYAASMQGHLSVVELLINHGTDVDYLDKKGRASLHFAAENGHLSVVELLINHGADVNLAAGDSGLRPLHFAAKNGHLSVVETLINHEADVNYRDTSSGETPLWMLQTMSENPGVAQRMAPRKGEYKKIIKLLKARGAESRPKPRKYSIFNQGLF